MRKEPLLIILTFDTDYDFYYTPKKLYSQTKMKEEMLSWSSLEEGIPIINNLLRDYSDSFGEPIKFTWFLLSDKRQKENNNEYVHIFKKYKLIWDSLTSQGDELGLHVHLIEKQGDLWVQSIDDDKNIETIKEMMREWKSHFKFKSIRVGYCYQSNRLMELWNKLGFKIDSTALPKRRMEGRQYFDWKETPEKPFFPSKSNYKIPGKDHYNLLEVPFSIFLSKLKDDKEPVYRYLNLSFHPSIIKEPIKNYVRNKLVFHSVTHFFEFIPRFNLSKEENLLISFYKESLVQNLNQIINECKKINRPFKFLCISDLLTQEYIKNHVELN